MCTLAFRFEGYHKPSCYRPGESWSRRGRSVWRRESLLVTDGHLGGCMWQLVSLAEEAQKFISLPLAEQGRALRRNGPRKLCPDCLRNKLHCLNMHCARKIVVARKCARVVRNFTRVVKAEPASHSLVDERLILFGRQLRSTTGKLIKTLLSTANYIPIPITLM